MTSNPFTRNKRSVWTVPTQPYSEAHFATFPEDLIKPCILAGSRPHDFVLDPFAGCGTTGLVARELGRSFTLIELNPRYAQLARSVPTLPPAYLMTKFLGKYKARKPTRPATHQEIRRLNSAFAYKTKLRLEADADQAIRRQETTNPPIVASVALEQANQAPAPKIALDT